MATNKLHKEHDWDEKEKQPHSATGLAGAKFEERKRNGFVQGSAGLEYGEVDGFRFNLQSTGHRHKESALGRKVRRGD